MRSRIEASASSLLIVVVSYLVSGCGYDGPRISIHDLRDRLDDSAQKMTVIDVRDSKLYRKGHIPGAENIPFKYVRNEVETIKEMKGDVAIICKCGRQALATVKQLQGEGIKAIFVEGGYEEWKKSGFPLKKGNRP